MKKKISVSRIKFFSVKLIYILVNNSSNKQNLEVAKGLFDKAGEYWRQAIKLAPNNYIEAQNWLKTTGRKTSDTFF